MPGWPVLRGAQNMKKINKTDLAVLTLCVLMFTVPAAFLPWMPERIPVHWGIDGEIDGWATRGGIFLGPLMGLGTCLLLKILPAIDPKKKNYQKFGRGYDMTRLCMALFFFFMQCLTLYSAFYPESPLEIWRLISVGVGVLLCVMGNFMPQFRHNYFVGIRTPWTLASEPCWRRTHRLAGPLWFWGGILLALMSLFFGSRMLFAAMLVLVCVITAIPCIYSYIIYKKEPDN